MSSRIKHPPSILEIALLPLSGMIVLELFHTRQNDLDFFFFPFLIAAIRLFIAQLQKPGCDVEPPPKGFTSAARACVALNQIAVFFLVLVEAGAVMATSPGTPWDIWLAVVALYGIYIALRLGSRKFWLIAMAATRPPSALL